MRNKNMSDTNEALKIEDIEKHSKTQTVTEMMVELAY